MKKEDKKYQFRKKCFLIAIIIIVVTVLIISIQSSQPKACTEEAKICPDGSAVGRVPPNCEFAPCPSESCKCPRGYILEGNACNPECYYSTPKCLMPSVSCDTIANCEIDSDCIPLECCHPTSCINKNLRNDCSGIGCTADCEGPLDCGAGTCGCVNNKCTVIPK